MADKIPNSENTVHSSRIVKSFVLSETTSDEILKLIDRLNENKACREDDIPVKFLKLSAHIISPFLI